MLSTVRGMMDQLKRLVVILALALFVSVGYASVSSTPAEAMSVRCGWPRCTLHLTKKETRNYAYYGVLPAVPSGTGVTQAVFYATAMAHRWFAIQYANSGKCVSFVLSAAPWEPQGLYGRRC